MIPGGREAAGSLDAALAAWHIQAIALDADRDAFAALFVHFSPRIKAYFMRLGANAAAAEDLAQETLLAVWRKASLFDPAKASPSTWIFTIARNLRIDARRRDHFPLAGEPENFNELPDEAPMADAVVERTQSEDRLRAALRELPEIQAEVVRLSFFEDRPHAEIARVLGIPLGTVKSRVRLAMARLRACLEES